MSTTTTTKPGTRTPSWARATRRAATPDAAAWGIHLNAQKRIAMYFCNALFGLMLFGFQNHFSSLSSAASVYCLFAGFSFLSLFIVVRIGTVDRGLRSICESRLFDCGIRQALQNLSNICIDADGLPLNFLRTNRLPLVDASVGGVQVLGCHLPEGVLDDDRGIIANA